MMSNSSPLQCRVRLMWSVTNEPWCQQAVGSVRVGYASDRSAVESAAIVPLWSIGGQNRPITLLSQPFVVVEPASKVRVSEHSDTVGCHSGFAG